MVKSVVALILFNIGVLAWRIYCIVLQFTVLRPAGPPTFETLALALMIPCYIPVVALLFTTDAEEIEHQPQDARQARKFSVLYISAANSLFVLYFLMGEIRLIAPDLTVLAGILSYVLFVGNSSLFSYLHDTISKDFEIQVQPPAQQRRSQRRSKED